MKMILFCFECANCNKNFEFPCVNGDSYGEFLLIDDLGEISYLNSFNDPIFQEVSKIFDFFVSKQDQDKGEFCRNLFSPVLSATCDLSSNHIPYQKRMPHCPTCHQSDFIEFGPIDPPKFVDLDIPNATHHVWNKLSDIEKKELIQTIITQTKIETRQALINEVKLFISALSTKKSLVSKLELKMVHELDAYLIELEKPNNEDKIKAADKKFHDFYFNNMEEINKDSENLMYRGRAKITSLSLKNGF